MVGAPTFQLPVGELAGHTRGAASRRASAYAARALNEARPSSIARKPCRLGPRCMDVPETLKMSTGPGASSRASSSTSSRAGIAAARAQAAQRDQRGGSDRLCTTSPRSSASVAPAPPPSSHETTGRRAPQASQKPGVPSSPGPVLLGVREKGIRRTARLRSSSYISPRPAPSVLSRPPRACSSRSARDLDAPEQVPDPALGLACHHVRRPDLVERERDRLLSSILPQAPMPSPQRHPPGCRGSASAGTPGRRMRGELAAAAGALENPIARTLAYSASAFRPGDARDTAAARGSSLSRVGPRAARRSAIASFESVDRPLDTRR